MVFLKEIEMKPQDIIAHASRVMRSLGTGHRECVYHKALCASLSDKRVSHRSEVVTPIMFLGECVGIGRADIIIDNIVIEIKANSKKPGAASGQLKKYIESIKNVEGKKDVIGMVVNFNQNTGLVEGLLEKEDVKRSRFFHNKK